MNKVHSVFDASHVNFEGINIEDYLHRKLEYDKALELLKRGFGLYLHTGPFTWECGHVKNWIGVDAEEGYKSLAIGEQIYDDPKQILDESLEYLSSTLGYEEVVITL